LRQIKRRRFFAALVATAAIADRNRDAVIHGARHDFLTRKGWNCAPQKERLARHISWPNVGAAVH
jgi:hypothetical protein